MPLHTWQCQVCQCEVEVLRSIQEPGDPPTKEETKVECKDPQHLWRKIIKSPPGVTRAPGFGRKGHWIIALGVCCDILWKISTGMV